MAVERIEWKLKDIFKADAEKCYREIEEMGEAVSPEQIVDKAKNKKTELHKCFDWNDKSAAHKYRLMTARKICQHIVVTVIEEDEATEPMKFRLIQNTSDGYDTMIRIQEQPDKLQELTERMKEDAENFVERYNTLPIAQQAITQLKKLY